MKTREFPMAYDRGLLIVVKISVNILTVLKISKELVL